MKMNEPGLRSVMTIDMDAAVIELNLIVARLANPQPMLQAIGDWQAEKVRERIRTGKVDPWNSEWAPWRPRTQAAREKKGNTAQGLLWDSGKLLGSITVESGINQVVIGTPLDYAAYLQDGTGKMAERAFMGWNDEDFAVAELFGVAYLEGIPT